MGMLIMAFALAAAQSPAVPAPGSGERRLTPEQVEEILAEAAAKHKASEGQATGGVEISDLEPMRAPRVHGEFGVSAGTGGYREIFGTGVYGLGADGSAAVSFDFVDFGNRSYRRNRY